jgi:sec-independent protein translocase protein TatB
VFDIGFTELVLIGIVALVVIGPERLPAVAKTAGQWIAKIQRFVRGVKTDLASELESGDLKKLIGDQREQINELKNMVTTAKKDFEVSSQSIVNDAKSKFDDMETSAKESEDSPSVQSTAQKEIETLDGQTVSIEKADDAPDIGRTGS